MPFLILIIFLPIQAQEEEQFEFDYTIQSKAFGDERKITVYLPPSYYKDPDVKYTVTYVLDGHSDPFINFGVKTIEYNNLKGKYTPTIVVGIHAKARGWEFSAPLTEEERKEYKGGRAPELQQHFKNEIFPVVDSLYKRTLPFRTLIGHSSGGKFVLYTLFSDEKDLFDAYIGISPALRPGENMILEDAVSRLTAGEKFPKFLYCSSGTVGEREELFGGAIKRLDSILNVYPNHGLIWRQSAFEGMDHFTCVGPSFNTAMVELTSAFRVDEKMFYEFANNEKQSMTEQIESFYKSRREEYGFIEIPSTYFLYRIALRLSNKNKKQDALEVCDFGLKQSPEHYRLNYWKGSLQLELKDKKGAEATYLKCLQLIEDNKEKWSKKRYAQRKKNVEEKLITF